MEKRNFLHYRGKTILHWIKDKKMDSGIQLCLIRIAIWESGERNCFLIAMSSCWVIISSFFFRDTCVAVFFFFF